MKLSFSFPAWSLRLLLAMLLLFGGELLLWSAIQQYDALDWLVRIAGYSALAVLILDLVVRYRVRDIYDVMMVLAIYALLAALLVTPEISLQNFPRSLLSRVLGGHGLLGMEMFGLLLVLTAGDNRRYRWRLLAVAAWIGFYWGVWMRWTPVFSTLFEAVPLSEMAGWLGSGLLLVLLCYLPVRRLSRTMQPLDVRLSPLGWLLLLLALILLFLVQALRGYITVGALLAAAFLIAVSWSVIWFRREEHEEMLLDQHLPARPLAVGWIAAALLIFAAGSGVGYALPLAGTPEYNQLWLMEIGFAAVGAVWIPLVAVVIAMRGLDYQMRTNALS